MNSNDLKNAIPTILTGIGCAGVITTSVLSGKASVKAHDILKEREDENLSKEEKFKAVWKEFIWTGVSGAVTLGSIIGSKVMDAKTIAGLASMVYVGAKKFAHYREQVVADHGVEMDQKIVEEVEEREKKEEEILEQFCYSADTPKDELVRYYDSYANEFFWTTPYKILEAKLYLNQVFQENGCVPITTFHDVLCINHHVDLEETGWDVRCVGQEANFWNPWISIAEQPAVDENGEPYLAIIYLTPPCTAYLEGCWD